MRLYKNMRISLKLIIGFGLIAIISVVVGITGVVNLQSIGNANNSLYEDNTL